MATRTEYEFLVRMGAQMDKSLDSVVKGISGKLGSIFTAGAVVKGVSSLNKKLNELQRNILTTSFTIAEESIDSYAKLETSVVNAANVFGGSQQKVTANQQKLLDVSKELSYQTKYSAVEIADAAYYMGLAGMDIEDAIDIDADSGISNLQNMLKLAAVSGEDVVTVIDLITDSMSAMGQELSASNVNTFMDELAVTMSSTNTNATQAMEALIKYAATAEATGISMEEQLGLIGVLANRGIKDSEAGTALNSIISRMVGNPEGAKGWAQAGISLYNDDGSFRGVVPLMTELAEKIGSFTKEEQNNLMYKIAGTRQLAKQYDILAALSKESENVQSEFDKLIADIGGSDGTLNQMFAEIEDTYAYQKAVFDNNVEGIKLELGEELLPIANKTLGFMTENMPQIRDLVSELGSTITQRVLPKMEPLFEKILTGLDTFLESDALDDTIDNIAGWFEDVVDWISGFDPVRLGDNIAQMSDNITGIVRFLLNLQNSKLGAWLGLGETVTEGLGRVETNTAFNKFARMTLAKGGEATEWSSYLTKLSALTAGTAEEYAAALGNRFTSTGQEIPKDIYELFGIDEQIYAETIDALGEQGDDVQRFMDQLNEALIEMGESAQIALAEVRQAMGYVQTYQGANATQSTKKVRGGTMTAFASGGIVTEPTLGLIGEAGENEAVIPLSKIGQVMRSLSGNGGGNITYAPVFQVSGGADEKVIRQAARDAFNEFKANYARLQKETARRAF